jgi:hypothetical protein
MDNKLKQKIRLEVKTNPIWGKAADILSNLFFPKAVNPKIGIAPHARFILWALSQYDKVLINLPRLHGKSTYVTFLYVMYCILTRRKRFILIVSSTGTQAVKFLTRIKYYLTSKKVRQYYGDLQAAGSVVDADSYSEYVDPNTKQKSKIWNFKEVMIECWGIRIVATSISSSNRGLLNIDDRPDLIILDDIEDRKNTNTLELRERLSDIIVEELFPAGAVGCQFVVIGTICHYGSFLLKLRKASGWFFCPFTRATDTIENILKFNEMLPDYFPDEYKFNPKQEYFSKDTRALDGKLYKAGDPTPEVPIWQGRYTYEFFCQKLDEYLSLHKELSFWQEFFNKPKSNRFVVFNEFHVEPDIRFEMFRGEKILKSYGDYIFPNGRKYINVYSFAGGDLAESKNLHSDFTVFFKVFTDPFRNVYVFPSLRIKEPNPVILAEYILKWHNEYNFDNCTFDGQHFQKWFKRVMQYLCDTVKDEHGRKIYKMPKVYQQPRSQAKEEVIYSTLSPYIRDERVVFCGQEEEFKNLFNELRRLGYNDTDDEADGLTYAMSNLRFPPEIDFDKVNPENSIVRSRHSLIEELEEFGLDESDIWYYV